MKEFEAYELEHVPRAENIEADILSKMALGGIPDHLLRICQKEKVFQASIDLELTQEVAQISNTLNPEEHPEVFWMEEIRRYNEKGDLPNDPAEAAKIQRRSRLMCS